MKRQWHQLVADHNDVLEVKLDPVFASTYGPVLAARRARFQWDESPAWSIWGRWLLGVKDAEGAAELLVLTMEAGIFFDYDPLTEFLLPQRWRPQGHLPPRLHMLLWVRPHVADLRTDILREFMTRPHIRRRAVGLDHLMMFMSRKQRESLVVDVALMLDCLDYEYAVFALYKVGNAALDVFSAARRIPDQIVEELFMMGCCEERSGIQCTSLQSYRTMMFDTIREYADRGVLKKVLARPVAATAIVDCFKYMSDSEEFENDNRGVLSLFRLLSETECVLQKRDLIKIGNALVDVTRALVLDLEEEGLNASDWDAYASEAFDEYRKLCKRCLPVAEALEVWQNIAWCYECLEMYNEE